MESFKEMIVNQAEQIVARYKYDFMFEHYEKNTLCQIVKRDHEGEIIGTLLSFHIIINEETGIGEFIFYNEQGEFGRQSFNVFAGTGLVEGFQVIQDRLLVNY